MKNKIIYQISIKDIYEVCQQTLDRNPTKNEIKFIEENLGNRISWFDIIDDLLVELEPENLTNK